MDFEQMHWEEEEGVTKIFGGDGKATATWRLFCEETCVYLRYIPIRPKRQLFVINNNTVIIYFIIIYDRNPCLPHTLLQI